MRILVLTQWYTPEPADIIAGLVAEFVGAGHQVEVLTGFPNYPSGCLYPGYRLKLLQREELAGVPVTRVPLYPDHGRSPVRRSLNYLSFGASAAIVGPLVCRRPDLIWVYHPPLTAGIPAVWLGLLHRAPFVYTVQDMWPETLGATGMLSSSFAFRSLGALARFIYGRAAAVTVISPGFRDNLLAKGVPPRKIHFIPNWADEAVYRPFARDPELGAECGLAGHFNVLFAGNLGAAQGLQTVVQAAATLQSQSDIQFVLIGNGVELPALRTAVEARELANVRFIDQQPSRQMPRFYAWADALLVSLRDDPLFRITIPSKTLTYLASGRPIICAVAGNAGDVVAGAGAGLVCEPANPQALAQAVLRLRDMPPAQREAMGRAGRDAFLHTYTRQAIGGQYLQLFEDVVGRRRSGGAPALTKGAALRGG